MPATSYVGRIDTSKLLYQSTTSCSSACSFSIASLQPPIKPIDLRAIMHDGKAVRASDARQPPAHPRGGVRVEREFRGRFLHARNQSVDTKIPRVRRPVPASRSCATCPAFRLTRSLYARGKSVTKVISCSGQCAAPKTNRRQARRQISPGAISPAPAATSRAAWPGGASAAADHNMQRAMAKGSGREFRSHAADP